ncbi:hypothetical protein NpNSSI1_00008420 [Neofusicoccum parvum]|nr:hypothetical protein NpNSSI1_00008420 [Neofusicoccum parvum]
MTNTNTNTTSTTTQPPPSPLPCTACGDPLAAHARTTLRCGHAFCPPCLSALEFCYVCERRWGACTCRHDIDHERHAGREARPEEAQAPPTFEQQQRQHRAEESRPLWVRPTRLFPANRPAAAARAARTPPPAPSPAQSPLRPIPLRRVRDNRDVTPTFPGGTPLRPILRVSDSGNVVLARSRRFERLSEEVERPRAAFAWQFEEVERTRAATEREFDMEMRMEDLLSDDESEIER